MSASEKTDPEIKKADSARVLHEGKELLYEGSVKRVYQCPDAEDSLLFEFSDDYSVFDWGKMPDCIENKGKALTLIGSWFFEILSKPSFWNEAATSKIWKEKFSADYIEPLLSSSAFQKLSAEGLKTHFLGLVDAKEPSLLLDLEKAACFGSKIAMKVKKALVERPESFSALGQKLFHYPNRRQERQKQEKEKEKEKSSQCSGTGRLIALELVFRFGMPEGSSLKERLEKDPAYARLLGLNEVPRPGEFFDRCVLEFFTKLEPKDRLLSAQEAVLISGLEPAQFSELCLLTQLIALGLYYAFAQKGIELWDGKLEFVLSDASASAEIVLADSIGPDELRLIYKGIHLSKEMIRQVYRGSNWEKNLKEAQDLARKQGRLDWKEICQKELNSTPERLPADAKAVIDRLYPTLANVLSGKPLFHLEGQNIENELESFVEAVGQARTLALKSGSGSSGRPKETETVSAV